MITDRKKAPACLRYNVNNNSGSINLVKTSKQHMILQAK